MASSTEQSLDQIFVVTKRTILATEPTVRIGIVLAADRRTQVLLETPAHSYSIHGETGRLPQLLPPNRTIAVTVDSGQLRLDIGATSRSGFRRLRLVPANTHRQCGITVRNILAGRGFHWQKTIDQTLSGVLEFRVRDNCLVMTNELPIEDYVVGVITAEMSGDCPAAYLKAHAVVSRSWLMAQSSPAHPGEPFTWCNDDCCQRYHGTSGWTDAAIDATAQTRGQVLMTKAGRILPAFYSKNSGGIVESPESVWRRPTPGLHAHVDGPTSAFENAFFPVTERNAGEYISGQWLSTTQLYASPNVVPEETVGRYLGRVDDGKSGFRWTTEVTQDELLMSVRRAVGRPRLAVILDIVPLRRGASGRIEEIALTCATVSGQVVRELVKTQHEIRRALSPNFLKSSAVTIDLTKDRRGAIARAVFRGAGWGHGVGFCQIGGLGRALVGQSHIEILNAYYKDVVLAQVYA